MLVKVSKHYGMKHIMMMVLFFFIYVKNKKYNYGINKRICNTFINTVMNLLTKQFLLNSYSHFFKSDL